MRRFGSDSGDLCPYEIRVVTDSAEALGATYCGTNSELRDAGIEELKNIRHAGVGGEQQFSHSMEIRSLQLPVAGCWFQAIKLS